MREQLMILFNWGQDCTEENDLHQILSLTCKMISFPVDRKFNHLDARAPSSNSKVAQPVDGPDTGQIAVPLCTGTLVLSEGGRNRRGMAYQWSWRWL